jgi:hypothetical protein
LREYDLAELELQADDAYFAANAATLGQGDNPRAQHLAWIMMMMMVALVVYGLGSRCMRI